jgi:hemoglobin
MKNKDIASRTEVIELVDKFYEKVKADEAISFIFSDIARVDWEKHMPVMYDFWESVLFYTASYTGNPMIAHRKLNNLITLTPEHFTTWLKLFHATIDENFSGDKAELAKQRSTSIATVMQLKIKAG